MHVINSSYLLRQAFKNIVIYKTNFCRGKKVSTSSDTKYKFNAKDNEQKIDLTTLSVNSILISESRDIYENLAFEDWLYNNLNFASQDVFILLMWYNSPSVVIGRHQNPWTECSLDFCQASGISIARRNSGGGTVYHDYGNLNCSFMTPRQKYNRKTNLQIISDAICKKWPINLSITKRDDILLDDKYKISGTASKLGRTNAYHHCTILINVDELKLKQALHRELLCVESRATSSIPATVKNLKTACHDIDISGVIEVIKEQYKSTYGVPEKNIVLINPKEDICPGIKSVVEHLKSWKWCFGHTPRFMITRNFPLCPSFSKWGIENLPAEIEIKLSLNKGIIESILLNPQILEPVYVETLKHCMVGMKFSPKIDVFLEKWIKLCNDEILCKFIKSCILQIILDVYR